MDVEKLAKLFNEYVARTLREVGLQELLEPKKEGEKP